MPGTTTAPTAPTVAPTRRSLRSRRHFGRLAAVAATVALATCGQPEAPAAALASAPKHLADTGLYADFASGTIAADVLSFTPQYPLWTDGAGKRRWIWLPPGTSIDASNADHWVFPAGTRLWKEFAFDAPVETRFMELRADGTWLYATYRWTADGKDAVLAPDCGVRNAAPTAGAHHDLPSVADCRLCHEGTRTPVLGFSALQLSADRDPLAPNAVPPAAGDVNLDDLLARGLLRNLPQRWQQQAPRIAARDADERATLGYLHGNCSSCHNQDGPLQRLGLRFDYPLATEGPAPAIATTVGVPSQFTRGNATTRVAAGAPERSVLWHRLAATDAVAQMPPFGRHLADQTAVRLVEQWIHTLAPATELANHERSSK